MTIDKGFFDQLRANQALYHPNQHTLDKLAGKTIIMTVGPAGIGKSTLMNGAVEQDPRLHRVPSFTTRQQRINDEPGMYHYIATDEDYEQLDHAIRSGNVAQYGVSPVKDVVYGTYVDDYLREYNLKDVWYSGVTEFENLPFSTKIIVGLVADPHDWKEWFAQRFEQGDPEALSRLDEAQQSLEWLLGCPDVKWLQNVNHDREQSAIKLVDICLGGQGQPNGPDIASQMLDEIPRMKRHYSAPATIDS